MIEFLESVSGMVPSWTASSPFLMASRIARPPVPAVAQEVPDEALADGFEAEAFDALAEGEAFTGEKVDEEPGDTRVPADRLKDRRRAEDRHLRIGRGFGPEGKTTAEEGDRLADEPSRPEPGDLELAALFVQLADPDLPSFDAEEDVRGVPLLEQGRPLCEAADPAGKPDDGRPASRGSRHGSIHHIRSGQRPAGPALVRR